MRDSLSDRRPGCTQLGRLLLLSLALLGAMLPAGAFAQGLSDNAREQIQALLQEKQTRTPVERKIDPNLLYALRESRGVDVAPGIRSIATGVELDARNLVEVDITAQVSDRLLARIEGLSGELVNVHWRYRSIRARVPLDAIDTIAADPSVVYVQPKQEAMHSGQPAMVLRQLATQESDSGRVGLRGSLPPGFEGRAARVRSSLTKALAARRQAIAAINVSEGDVTHRANLARSTYGAAGAGVRIGVLSDGADSLVDLQVSGDLPGDVTVLPGQAGSGEEGAAMLEIVHDLAPLAKLYFATAFGGITSFAQNIRDLRAAGCDIIIDDVFYFVETPFQKGQAPSVLSTTNGGVVIEAANEVAADGALFFSSAGNSGNLNDSQSGTWEGDYLDGGPAGGPLAGTGQLHNFGGGMTFDTITVGNGSPVNLFWSDSLGGSANDYDLFILNSTGTTVLGFSTAIQDGTQDPYEQITGTVNVTGNRVVIVKFSGAARFLHLGTNRSRLSIATAGETHGHNSAPHANAFGVAATDADGPFPGVFGPTDVVETFSSDGPRRYFFEANGAAITPGNFSSTGGQVLQRPSMTAADGVMCAAPGFNPFFGTSAAAPHAGAIAALVKSASMAATPAQIAGFLTSTAIDIEAAGVDRDSGVGILDALGAVQATGVTPQAFLLVGTTTATESSGNGNTFVEPGECGTLAVQLTNGNASVAATAISATLTTSTPGVTVFEGTSAYTDIPGGGSGSNLVPFEFTVDNAVVCPVIINFTLAVTFSGGSSPEDLHFAVRAGLPPWTISTTLDTTVPSTVPGATSATGLQTPRLNRNTVEGTCGNPKPFPGVFSTGTRRFDSYTYTNCSSSTVCIDATLTQTAGAALALQLAGYSPTFDPNNLATNYESDPGVSGNLNVPIGMSFEIPAGQTFVLVVNEVNMGGGIGASYTLDVDGLCFPCQAYTGVCCPDIDLTPATLPAGTSGSAYPNTIVTPTVGTAPFTFNVSGLPAGMTPTSQVVGPSVTIGGTPAAPFSGTVTVSGTDADGCPFSQNYGLIVNCPPPPSTTITAPSTVCAVSSGHTASVPDAGPGATYVWTVTNGTITAGQGTRTLTFSAGATGPLNLNVVITNAPGCSATGNLDVPVSATCGNFYTLTPCRVLDTRLADGPLGGPSLIKETTRTFALTGTCGIPASATAVSINVTVTGPTDPGHLRVFPGGNPLPAVSTINYSPGQTRANNAIVPLGPGGTLDVYCGQAAGTIHFILDINGYFGP